MKQRVVLGALPGGGYGLRTSLYGNDVITGNPNDPAQFSFSSDWTDLVGIVNVGLITLHFSSANFDIPITNQGFKPYFEIRYISGNTIYDEYNPLNAALPGNPVNCFPTFLRWALAVGSANEGLQYFYIVFDKPQYVQ